MSGQPSNFKTTMKNFTSAALFFLTLFLVSANTFAQKNSYKFIEPNISISYDSNRFQITNRYSNTSYETESYDFEFKPDTVNKVNINISANSPIDFPPRKTRDSLMLLGLSKIKSTKNKSFDIVSYDQQVRDIDGFSCLGFVSYNKRNKQYATIINCYHFSTDDYTEIKYLSINKNNLDADYELLKNFLSDFKTYSEADIINEENLIKSKYTVIVIPEKTTTNGYQNSPETFVGIVKTKEKLENTIKEVRLTNDFGKQIFSPEPNGSVSISCNDKEKGKVIKRGELVLLNSFGKSVKIPFTFSYDNDSAR
jgi:hypothetical protein